MFFCKIVDGMIARLLFFILDVLMGTLGKDANLRIWMGLIYVSWFVWLYFSVCLYNFFFSFEATYHVGDCQYSWWRNDSSISGRYYLHSGLYSL